MIKEKKNHLGKDKVGRSNVAGQKSTENPRKKKFHTTLKAKFLKKYHTPELPY